MSRMRHLIVGVATTVGVLVVSVFAFAETPVTVAGKTVDLYEAVIAVVGLALTGLSTVASLALRHWWASNQNKDTRDVELFGLKLDDSHRAAMERAVQGAIGYAEEAIARQLKDKLKLPVRDEMVAIAANEVVKRVPDALGHFGITDEGVKYYIKSRMATPEVEELKVANPGVVPAPILTPTDAPISQHLVDHLMRQLDAALTHRFGPPPVYSSGLTQPPPGSGPRSTLVGATSTDARPNTDPSIGGTKLPAG